MDAAELIAECKKLITEREKIVIFDSAMIVKNSPHNEIFRAYAVVLTADDKLMLMDAEQQWHELHPKQLMIEYMAQTIFQRLKTMEV